MASEPLSGCSREGEHPSSEANASLCVSPATSPPRDVTTTTPSHWPFSGDVTAAVTCARGWSGEGGGLTPHLDSQHHVMPQDSLFLVKPNKQINTARFQPWCSGTRTSTRDLARAKGSRKPVPALRAHRSLVFILQLIVSRPDRGFLGHLTHGVLSSGAWQGCTLAAAAAP